MPVFNNILAGAAGQGGAAAEYVISKSLRFNPGDSPYLNKVFATSGNRRTYTLSFWHKQTTKPVSGTDNVIAGHMVSGFQTQTIVRINGLGQLEFGQFTGSWNFRKITSRLLTDPASFYHIVISVDTTSATAEDRIKIYINGVRETQWSTNTNPAQNLETLFNSNVEHGIGKAAPVTQGYCNGLLADFQLVDGQALAATNFGEFSQETGVWNPIAFTGSRGNTGFHLNFSDNSSDAALGYDAAGSNNWTVHNLTASAPALKTITRFRFKTDWNWLYVSGVRVNGNNVTGTLDNSASVWSNINAWQNGSHGSGNETYSQSARGDWFDVTLTSGIANFRQFEVHLYLDSSAGSTTNVFEIELFFSDNTSQTKVYPTTADAPNQNAYGFNSRQWQDFGSVGLALPKDQDSLIDSPTNHEADTGNNLGNYCTWNPLAKFTGVQGISAAREYSQGNLQAKIASGNQWAPGCGTISVNSGKWYAEFEMADASGTNHFHVGINPPLDHFTGVTYHSASNSGHWYGSNGQMWNAGTASSVGAVATANNGDIIGIALDFDASTVTFYKNGTSLTSVSLNSNITTHGAVFGFDLYPTCGVIANWGQRPFAISSVPTGHKSLCTQNLPDPLIGDPSTAMKVVTYTGDNNTSRTITTGLSPDLVWLKTRNNQGGDWSHRLFDTVRGIDLAISSNSLNAEENRYTATCGGVHAFNSDGFTLSQSGGNVPCHNATNNSMVAWTWDGGNLATNSAYNQSEVWSDNTTGAFASSSEKLCFNGKLSTSSTAGRGRPNNGTTAGFTFSNLGTVTSLKIWVHQGGTGGTVFTVNGTDVTSTVDAATNSSFVDFGSTFNSLTAITFNAVNGSNWYSVAGIEVNGKLLVDAGVIPAGSLNSSVYTQNDVYSDDLATSGSASGSVTNAFDGNFTTQYSTSTGGAYTNPITFTPSGGLSYTSSVKVYCPSGQMAARINGGSWVSFTTDAVIATGSGSITTIEVTERRSSAGFGLYAIEVDGKILVDSNQTPPNVPSIASTVRANPTAGFSIVTYSQGSAGSVVAHGLNKKPGMIIAKSRTSSAQPWVVYHSALGAGGVLQLHNTAGNNTTYPTYWGSEEPDSYVFGTYTGSAPWANNDGNMVAYCFTAIEGYSAISSYISTGGDNFIHTGFRPAFLICKKVVNSADSSYEGWVIFDSERGSYNINQQSLYSNTNYVEGKRGNDGTIGSTFGVDFLSNGFAFRDASTEYNRADSSTYVYYCVAKNPFKYARAR